MKVLPLEDRIARDTQGPMRDALGVIAPLLYDGEDLGKVADALADFLVASVAVTLKLVVPYREV